MQSTSRAPRGHGLYLLMLCTLYAGCGEEDPYRKPTVPVTGQITVDGTVPGTPVQITCHSLTGIDTEHPTFSKTVSGEDGTFAISTYESGDGVPPGEYAVTFEWKTLNLVSMGYSGPDKLALPRFSWLTSRFAGISPCRMSASRHESSRSALRPVARTR